MYGVPSSHSVEGAQGKALYGLFNKFIKLRQNMRQGGDDQAEFRDLLSNARNGEWSEDNWKQLNAKAWANLSNEEKSHFMRATYLFPTNEKVNIFNRENLKRMN